MTLKELLEDKEYVFIKYWCELSRELFMHPYAQEEMEDDIEEDYVNSYIGNCVYENGYLKSLDGNCDYSLYDEIERYEWEDEDALSVWVEDSWFTG